MRIISLLRHDIGQSGSKLIDALKSESAMQRGVDVITGDTQTLIATVHARLTAPRAPVRGCCRRSTRP